MTEIKDGRMTEAQFRTKYGSMLAFSSWGGRWVGSALTKRHYIWFDHKQGSYVVEAR